jgi:transcription antitermination factor NusG
MPEDIWAARIDMVSRWFVVHAQPHRELVAHANLANQGFRSFLPLHTKTVRHARQFRTAIAPFFPRYLFVELALGRDRWRSVTGTFGVSHLIMEGDRPKPVAPGVVEAIIAMADETGMICLDAAILPGQVVRISAGPFAGLVGKMLKLDVQDRVKVLLDLMGSKVSVSVARDELVPAA